MQNDYNPQFNLSIETHEGIKHLHPLNADDVRIFSKFAISGTPRKQIMQNFFHSIKNQSPEKFAHIQKWIEGILAGDKTKFFTVQIERIEQQAEIPNYLRCEPRTFKVTHHMSDTCDLQFTLVIKCTDEMLHEHNTFWSDHQNRLDQNGGDIVKVMLKMIAVDVFNACFQGKANVGYAQFSIATSERWQDKQTGEYRENTEWHRIVAHGRLGEIACQYLKKGSKVYIEGSLHTRKWTDQNRQENYITEVKVHNLQALDSAPIASAV